MTEFIADIGSNHNKDLDRCNELIKTAKRIGCWGVKFQLFEAEKLYHSSFPERIEKMKQWELPVSFLCNLKEICEANNIKFGITPFSLEAAAMACLHVDFFKISSYDILRLDLIKACCTKPLIISTGGANRQEIWDILRLFWNRPDYAPMLLHCVSEYPTKPEEVNMYKLDFLKTFGTIVGWSDHTVEEGVIYQAVAKGSDIIEFHLDLEDGLGYESYVGHCWHPDDMERVIYNVRVADVAEGGFGGEGIDKQKIDIMRSWRSDPEDGLRPLKSNRINTEHYSLVEEENGI